MLEGLVRLEAAFGIPLETLVDEIYKAFVGRFQGLAEWFRARTSLAPLGIRHYPRVAVRVKEQFPPRALLYEMVGRDALDLHNTCELFLFILSWEEGVSCEKVRLLMMMITTHWANDNGNGSLPV